MSEWLVSLEGTEAGHDLALVLALAAAFLHAVFGSLQKGRFDPWLTRGAIDIWLFLLAAPFAIFVVPLPEPHMWPIFAGAVLIHVIYKMLASAGLYQRRLHSRLPGRARYRAAFCRDRRLPDLFRDLHSDAMAWEWRSC